jgi:uncharacterized OB-fold protein
MANDPPFTVAIVDLGVVRLSARIDGAAAEDLAITGPVEFRIVEIDGPADYDRVWFRMVPVEG